MAPCLVQSFLVFIMSTADQMKLIEQHAFCPHLYIKRQSISHVSPTAASICAQ